MAGVGVIVIAGGGTGGHLVPAMVMADGAAALGRRPVLVTGDRPIEDRVLAGCPHERRILRARGYATVGWAGRLRALLALPGAVWRAWRWLGDLRPEQVVLTGGYVALPVGLAAWLRRFPQILIEPNCVPGRTARLLARFVQRLILLDPAVHLPGRAERTAGMPVRTAIRDLAAQAPTGETVLVLGGSQGAAALNRHVAEAWPAEARWHLHHVSGPGRSEEARSAYAERGITAVVEDYLEDTATALAAAAFVIARAGAGTVAELIAAARPAVLVPYPHAADDHQRANAHYFARLGGGFVVEEGPEFVARLAAAIGALSADSARREAHARLREVALEFDPKRLLLAGGGA